MFNNDFYPTPKELSQKMLSKIDFSKVKTILEPSAGKGDLAEAINEKMNEYHRIRSKDKKFDIDCIELDENLQYIIRGKGYRLIHNDFLTFNNFKRYDLILANFPFSNGAKHLLKALEIIHYGGQLCCLLNAETIKNTYSNDRKALVDKLESYNAAIEFIDDAFVDAERKTDVEIALIYISIPTIEKPSIILDKLKQEEVFTQSKSLENNQIIDGNFLIGIIQQYNFEIQATLNLINEYNNLLPIMVREFNSSKYPILELQINDGEKYHGDTLTNETIRNIRYKYWQALFSNDQITQTLTNDMRYEWYDKIKELKDYDFSLYNIQQIQLDINKTLITSVKDTILALFDEFSYKNSWYPETNKNIHYYDGWASNSAHKVNKKIVTTINGYGNWSGGLDLGYKFKEKMQDIEKVFNYLSCGNYETHEDLVKILNKAQQNNQIKKIETRYFLIDVYKKGTTHLTFKDEKLLDLFNRYAAQSKNWLPPSYGKKHYNDMSPEEKQSINAFEGEKKYNEVMTDPNKYLWNTNSVLMIC